MTTRLRNVTLQGRANQSAVVMTMSGAAAGAPTTQVVHAQLETQLAAGQVVAHVHNGSTGLQPLMSLGATQHQVTAPLNAPQLAINGLVLKDTNGELCLVNPTAPTGAVTSTDAGATVPGEATAISYFYVNVPGLGNNNYWANMGTGRLTFNQVYLESPAAVRYGTNQQEFQLTKVGLYRIMTALSLANNGTATYYDVVLDDLQGAEAAGCALYGRPGPGGGHRVHLPIVYGVPVNKPRYHYVWVRHLKVPTVLAVKLVTPGNATTLVRANVYGEGPMHAVAFEYLGPYQYTTSVPPAVAPAVGTSPGTAVASTAALVAAGVSSGVYYFSPTGWTGAPVPLFVDLEKDGGGWVVVSKWGGYVKSINRVFNADFYDDSATMTSLVTPFFLPYAASARLSRTFVNLLWAASRYTVRVHFENADYTPVSGVYFQKKVSNAASLDFWKAHYSPLYWTDMVALDASFADTGGGSRCKVTFARATTDAAWTTYTSVAPTVYNPATNDIVGGTALNSRMGFWDRATVTAPNLGDVETARHMGFFGDISDGNQWLQTCNPGDSRFATNESRRSVVFLRLT